VTAATFCARRRVAALHCTETAEYVAPCASRVSDRAPSTIRASHASLGVAEEIALHSAHRFRVWW